MFQSKVALASGTPDASLHHLHSDIAKLDDSMDSRGRHGPQAAETTAGSLMTNDASLGNDDKVVA